MDSGVISRTNKYYVVGLATMAIESPDSADEKDLCPRIKEGAEGQEGAEAEVIEERAVEMSDDNTDATP